MDATGAAPGRGGDLTLRVVSALVLAVVALAAAWLGGWVAALLVAVLVAIVFREWALMTAKPEPAVLYGFAGVAALAALLAGIAPPWVAVAVAAAGTVGAAAIGPRPWLAAGMVYATALGIALLVLRSDPGYGLAAIAFLFAAVWAADTAAYFAGRAIGGPKLWPAVSPKKTWSGFAGGMVAGIAAGLVAAAVAGIAIGLTLGLVAFVLALASVAGDLFESAVKRRFGTKDASGLIPGHGGMMDRVDGLTFAAVAAALVGTAHGGAAPAAGLLLW